MKYRFVVLLLCLTVAMLAVNGPGIAENTETVPINGPNIDGGFPAQIDVSCQRNTENVTLTTAINGNTTKTACRWQYKDPLDDVWVDIKAKTDQSLAFGANAVNIMHSNRAAVADLTEED